MKKTLLILMAVCMVASIAGADTLTVNSAAAMGGTGTACGGGNCGLDVLHDNTSAAYVRDDSPTAETVYRFEYLFDPNAISPEVDNWRQAIFGAFGPNPRPNNPGNPCPTSATVQLPLMRVFLWLKGGSGQNYFVVGHLMGNQCGNRQVGNISIPDDGPVKICGELETGTPGRGALAVVGVGDACPATGDAAWSERDVNNVETNVENARMGPLGTNNFAQGENGHLYFDEFASFRTLNP